MKTLSSLLACLCVNMPSIVAVIILNFCTQVASSSANACLWKSHNKDCKHSNYCYLWLRVEKEYFLVDGPLLTCSVPFSAWEFRIWYHVDTETRQSPFDGWAHRLEWLWNQPGEKLWDTARRLSLPGCLNWAGPLESWEMPYPTR